MPVTVARQSQPSHVGMQVMSPHQRVFNFDAPTVKSRLIRSALAAAAGSGIVVFFHRKRIASLCTGTWPRQAPAVPGAFRRLYWPGSRQDCDVTRTAP